MFQRSLVILLLAVGLTVGCNEKMQNAESTAKKTMSDKKANMLTPEEVAEGWTLLFDGKSMDQWRNFQSDAIGQSWKVDGGSMVLVTAISDGKSRAIDGGDIITKERYENFDFKIDWMISECGNSGIMWGVQEGDFEKPYHTGPEMQILDNTCHPDAKIDNHRAGDLYDLVPVSEETVKPAGEWNSARMRMENGNGTFWLNGKEVVNFTMFDDAWKEMVANSKFKQWPSFGTFREGHICLQDHNDTVHFRNIKVRRL